MNDVLVFNSIEIHCNICCGFDCTIALKSGTVFNKKIGVSSLMSSRFCDFVSNVTDDNLYSQICLIANKVKHFIASFSLYID